jgi:glycosyltransferase involved in cell wall biosynthesis
MVETNPQISTIPKFSVITVVYNGFETLERTILSVQSQTYLNIEHIIIDGGSTDGTVELIRKYELGIVKWISEPDNGLYDAMNKGINMASGQYLWFVNSGDEINGPNVIDDIYKSNSNADMYYGETIVVDSNGKTLGERRLKPPENLTWKDFRKGMLVSHQSVIVRKEICGFYDTSYKFSADYSWVLSALKKSDRIQNTHMVMSRFLEGGLTKQNILPGLKERFQIMVKNYGLWQTIVSHVPIAYRFARYYLKHGRF